MINIFRGLPADDLPAHQVMRRVLYDPTEQAMAATVSDALEGKGFVVTETGTLGSSARNTAVRYAPGNERIATEIARHIDPVPQLVEDPSYKDGRTVLVVGQDIVGVRSEPRPLDQITRGTTPGSSTSTTVAPTTTVLAHPNCDS
ncbi:MAG: LytR C-terminal domain-containing protein [Acidimicrobiales bacterium]